MSFTRADYPPLSTIAYVSTLTGVTFKPTDISGCQLWLDGADPAGTGVVPSNGTVLTSWIDKSGNAKNATGVNSPTVVTSAINSKSVVSYNGSSYSYSSIAANTFPSAMIIFIVYKVNGSVSYCAPITRSTGNMGYPIDQYNVTRYLNGTGLSSAWSHASATSTTIFTQVILGTGNITEFVNGSTTSSLTSTFTYSDSASYVYIGTRDDKVTSFNGYMCEAIVYNNASMTLAQRQSVEGYLAWKWGLQANLPGTHPYASTNPNTGYTSTLTSSLNINIAGYNPIVSSYTAYVSTIISVIFDPTSIGGGILWLDASKFTQANNTDVTTWPSASASYSLSMTGSGTVKTNILNGLPVISVSTSQNWSLSAGYTTAAYTFFFVSRQTGGTNGRVFIGNGNRLYGYWAGNKNSLYTEGWIVNLNASDTAWDIYTIVRTSAGAGTFSRFGGNLATYSSSGAGMDGFYVNTGGCCGGETSDAQIAEVLIYNVDLSDANCRKIEGYLAWKWGLQANLTSGHPYASSGPNSTSSTLTSSLASMVTGYTPKTQVPLASLGYYTAFNPVSLSTLALWIDGADPLGTGVAPAQGTLLSSLKDKSSKNIPISTFSTTVGFPTYKTAANGAFGAIQLATGNGLLISTFAISPYMTLYAVYSPINPNTGIAIEQGLNALSTLGFLLTSVSTTSTMYVINGGGVTVTATGGTITTSGAYKIHTFTTTGANTFTITSPASVSVTYLVVAGGGGGGVGRGGGGGGGGVLAGTTTLTAGTYTITVGAGGSNAYNDNQGGDGGSSSIAALVVATGGGGGGGWTTNAGRAGGSGGGASAGSTASGGTGVSGQGYAGSARLDGNTGGGGGGAGAAASGSGGAIGVSSMITGVTTYYAGGGGAGASSGSATGVAYGGTYEVANGTYGGGNGANTQGTHHNYQDAVANTGGGGGGQEGYGGNSGYGGSGIVILSYQLLTQVTPVATGGTITTFGAYKIHTFTTTGATTFTLTSPASISAQVLVVAGGGSGGSAYAAGGGGAGGAVYNAAFTITSGSYTVTVGAGGARTAGGVGNLGNPGSNSSFSTLTGYGGGGGASYSTSMTAGSGGCGGGSTWGGSAGTGSQGYGGGLSASKQDSLGYNCGGGGGGMGSVGVSPLNTRPNGGSGATYTVGGTAYLVSGGGGAGSDGLGGLGLDGGGLGGNGNGGGNTPSNGSDATGYGGGGGGGGGNNGSLYGGAGYQGIVIIAYLA